MIHLPKMGSLTIFVYAVLFAIIVWLIGMLGSLILKDVAKPSPSTLAAALICAALLAGLTMIPDAMKAIAKVVPGVPKTVFPLIGAVIGYAIKR